MSRARMREVSVTVTAVPWASVIVAGSACAGSVIASTGLAGAATLEGPSQAFGFATGVTSARAGVAGPASVEPPGGVEHPDSRARLRRAPATARRGRGREVTESTLALVRLNLLWLGCPNSGRSST